MFQYLAPSNVIPPFHVDEGVAIGRGQVVHIVQVAVLIQQGVRGRKGGECRGRGCGACGCGWPTGVVVDWRLGVEVSAENCGGLGGRSIRELHLNTAGGANLAGALAGLHFSVAAPRGAVGCIQRPRGALGRSSEVRPAHHLHHLWESNV